MDLPEWLWIVMEKDGNVENLFGQYDEEFEDFFIPAFYDREDGRASLKLMQKIPGRSYEIQAMRAAEVTKTAPAHAYRLFVLDGTGRVLKPYNLINRERKLTRRRRFGALSCPPEWP